MGFAPKGDTITAHSDDVSEHIQHLWKLSYRQLAEDCGRDQSDSNTTIVRLVTEARLASETRWMRIATWVASGVALLVGIGSVLAVAVSN